MSGNGFAKVYGLFPSVTIRCDHYARYCELHPMSALLYAGRQLKKCAPRLPQSLDPL